MKNGKDNVNPESGASQAWGALLADLKTTPLDIPSSWPEETSARWDDSGNCLIVTVPPSKKEKWIDKRFLPLAKIYFGKEHGDKELVVFQNGGESQDKFLARVQHSVYDKIIEPNKLVPVQLYFFNHWLPVLGASPFWVVIAMRQVSFVSQADDSSVLKPVSSRALAKWTPLRHVQVAEWINKGGFSTWFYKKTKDSYEDVPPEYTVWSKVPVAPHHLAWIEEFIDQYREEETAASILGSLLDQTEVIRRVKPGDIDVPPSYTNKRKTLLDVVSEHFPGNLSRRASDLLIQLEQQITRPNLAITIPHYFFKKYMNDLSSNEAALIWYLRSLYKEDDKPEVRFSGYTSLETALGCGNRTPKRLLEKCLVSEEEVERSGWDSFYKPSLSLGNWLSARYLGEYQKGAAREYSIKIRASEPIHDDDRDRYQRLLKRSVDDLRVEEEFNTKDTHNRTGDTQKHTEDGDATAGIRDAQTRTGDTQNQTGDTQTQTDAKQNKTGLSSKTEHNNNLNAKESFKSLLSDSLTQPQGDRTQPQGDSKHRNPPTFVVGVDEINLEKLLGFGSYKKTEKKNIIALIKNKHTLFLAWIIRNHITAADFPVRLAVSNIKEENVTEEKYLELAALGWRTNAHLVKVNEHDLSMWDLGVFDGYEDQEELFQIYKELSSPAKRELVKLRETNFVELFENVKDEIESGV